MHAFLPAEAHVSQNPVFVVVKVNLACWREESMSQFSCDTVETMVQIGLQTVCVVDGVEACQNKETHISESRREVLISLFLLCARDDELQKTDTSLLSLRPA